MSKFTKETSRKAIEARDGIKLLCYIRTVGSKKVATGVFRGKEYSVKGASNLEVLDRLFKVLDLRENI